MPEEKLNSIDSILQRTADIAQTGALGLLNPGLSSIAYLLPPSLKVKQGLKESNPRKIAEAGVDLAAQPVGAAFGPAAGAAVYGIGGALAQHVPSHTKPLVIDSNDVDLGSVFKDANFNRMSLTDQQRDLSRAIPDVNKMDGNEYLEWRAHEGYPVENAKQHTLFDTVLNIARPMIAGAAGGMASKYVPGSAPIVKKGVELGTYALTDAIAQHVQNNAPSSMLSTFLGVQPGTLGDTLLSTGEQYGVGKALEHIVPRVAQKLKGGANPDEVLQTMGITKEKIKDFDALHPSYSQYYQWMFGDKAKVSQVVEDTFNAAVKGKLLTKAEANAINTLKGSASSVTEGTLDPHLIAKDVAALAEENLHKSVQFSNLEASKVHNAAQLSSKTYQPGQTTQQGNQLVLEGFNQTQQTPITVSGPIRGFNMQNTIAEIEQSLEQIPKEDPAVGPMRATLAAAKARMSQQDVNGETIPMSFKESWELSKLYGRQGWQSKLAGETPAPTTFMGGNYRKLWGAMTQDIQDSIPTWEGQNGEALTNFQNAKQAVSDRNLIFSENGLNNLISNPSSRLATLDKSLKDPAILQNILSGSELKLPNGTVQMTNARQKISGYALTRMLDSSSTETPLAGQKFDSQKFFTQWNDPEFQQSKNLLFNKETQTNITELLKNTSAMKAGTGSGYGGATTKLVGGGLALGGGLINGMTSTYGAAVGVMGVSGWGLAKLLSNTGTAKLLIASSKGAPLGMSGESASKMIAQVLNGAVVTLTNPDGSKTDAKIQGGKIVPY